LRQLNGEVHVWYVFTGQVRDEAVIRHYDGLMTAAERARHDRFVFPRDRHTFLVTRGLVRTLLGEYLGIAPTACSFRTNEHGRPILCEAPADIDFNISHTAGLVAVAIAPGPEVGLDVEHVGRRSVTPNFARRFFSPSEADALDALPEEARRDRFFDYWTLKEAYIKARGIGLTLPLGGFSMELTPGAPPRIRFAEAIADDPASWQFAQYTVADEYRLALAVRRHGRDLNVKLREFRPALPSS
jgi:4'-phosphopantetheinyl transferase